MRHEPKEIREAQSAILRELSDRIEIDRKSAMEVAYRTGEYNPVAEARASAYSNVQAMITGFLNDLL